MQIQHFYIDIKKFKITDKSLPIVVLTTGNTKKNSAHMHSLYSLHRWLAQVSTHLPNRLSLRLIQTDGQHEYMVE